MDERVIRTIRIGEHTHVGALTDDHIGRYVIIRPEGSDADVMARLNRITPMPYRHRVGLELEYAWPPQNYWAPAPAVNLSYDLDETAPVAIVQAFEE